METHASRRFLSRTGSDTGGSYRVCDGTGQWQNTVNCTSDKPSCVDGECVGSFLRFAHFISNGELLHVNACISQDGTTFFGPILSKNEKHFIKYLEVSQYTEVPVGEYKFLRPVGAEATDCSQKFLPNDVEIFPQYLSGAGKFTLAVYGQMGGQSPKNLRAALYDDTDYNSPPAYAIRVNHYASALPEKLDVVSSKDGSFSPFISAINLGERREAKILNYPEITLTVGLSPLTVPAQVALSLKPFSMKKSQISSIFLSAIYDAPTLDALLCYDQAPPIKGLSDCEVISVK